MQKRDVFIVDATRTPIGKYGGTLKDVRPDDMAAGVIKEIVRRNFDAKGINKELIEDVILGCANQAGEDNRNVARMSALLAELPITVGGSTVNRLCGSGMQAVIDGARAIALGEGDIIIAGGTESMTRAPFVMPKSSEPFSRTPVIYDTTIGWRFTNPKLAKMYYPFSMGETAENVASSYKISREKQDEFACISQMRAKEAILSGKFKDEITPVEIVTRDGVKIFDVDEFPRLDTTMEKLSKLKPAFVKENGTVTAGNSSGINDGASALLLVSEDKIKELNFTPRARFVASAVAGVQPDCMGLGPIPATGKALKRAGLKIEDIDLIELNEAFASQSIACIDELGLDREKVNVNGGSIALGHPLGMSGARLITTLLYEMERRNSRFGLATMCIGVGQGIASIWERV
ncbi:MAG: acetyl-CoA C-acyltransferase [Ignavibacteriae bacterium]|nr:MAG: acetyl-CoA C-acyltransferase [Ignavibacteriota bacterium]